MKALLQAYEGLHVIMAKVNVGDKTSVAKARKELKNVVVDILVLNAGIVSGKDYLADIPEHKVRQTFDVNVMQLFWVSQEFLPSMIERDSGHIVTIASMAGLIGVNRMSDYSTSKWAAVGFAENLRAELKHRKTNIQTTCILPTFLKTLMFEGVSAPFLMPLLDPEYVSERIVDAVMSHREFLGLPVWAPRVVALVRCLLPTWLGDPLATLFGFNKSMETVRCK